MRKNQQRCQHCGKWVEECALYTLQGTVQHQDRESVAICEQCFEAHNWQHWNEWLERRFGAAITVSTRTAKPSVAQSKVLSVLVNGGIIEITSQQTKGFGIYEVVYLKPANAPWELLNKKVWNAIHRHWWVECYKSKTANNDVTHRFYRLTQAGANAFELGV